MGKRGTTLAPRGGPATRVLNEYLASKDFKVKPRLTAEEKKQEKKNQDQYSDSLLWDPLDPFEEPEAWIPVATPQERANALRDIMRCAGLPDNYDVICNITGEYPNEHDTNTVLTPEDTRCKELERLEWMVETFTGNKKGHQT